MGSNFMDEIDCFFNQIDDLIEFPADNLDSGDCTGDFPTIWSNPPADALPTADPIFSGNYSTSTGGGSDISAELSVPYEDIVQLEWLSNFVEDSFSGGGMTLDKDNFFIHNESSQNQLQNSSPISVLESSSSSSSSSCSKGKTIPTQRGLQRARSKRPRPPTFNPRPAIPLIPSPVPSSESENFAESYRTEVVVKRIPKAAAAENKKKTKLLPSMGSPVEMNQNLPPLQSSVRKCLHCEITKTPQWRSGPMGPKTLCNACGVRHKSGRLFPEYRPAASPTFVPSLHSNSHKKVIEMRNKVSDDTVVLITATTTPSTTNQPELIPSTF